MCVSTLRGAPEVGKSSFSWVAIGIFCRCKEEGKRKSGDKVFLSKEVFVMSSIAKVTSVSYAVFALSETRIITACREEEDFEIAPFR